MGKLEVFLSNFQESKDPGLQRKGLGRWFELLEVHPMKLFWSNLLTFAFLSPCIAAVFFMINLWDWLSIAAVWFSFTLAGPAVTALHFVCIQVARGKPVWLKEDYWESFRREWKGSLLLSAIIAALWLGYILCIRAYVIGSGGIEFFSMLVFVCGGFLLTGFTVFSYQQLAMIELPFGNIMRNSLLLIFAGGVRSFVTVLFAALCIGLCICFYGFALFVLLLGFYALSIMTVNFIFLPVFDRFFPEKRGKGDETEDESGE